MTDRKKPTTGFWITVALVVGLMGYPLTSGPRAGLRAVSIAAHQSSGAVIGQCCGPAGRATSRGGGYSRMRRSEPNQGGRWR